MSSACYEPCGERHIVNSPTSYQKGGGRVETAEKLPRRVGPAENHKNSNATSSC